MGKRSSYPSYSTGTLNLNGQTKAKTYRSGNNVITDYNMSKAEKKAYDYAQDTIANSLDSINILDSDTQKRLQSQLNAYTGQGQKIIENLYTPMLNNLKNDIASRFGNFNNSVFFDNLKSIESKRADSMSGLAQDILTKRDEFVNSELSRRYAYLSFLQGIQNQVNSNALNLMTSSQQNSASGNNYNAQAFAYNNAPSGGLFGDFSNLASSALLTSGNPFAIGAGLGLNLMNKYM